MKTPCPYEDCPKEVRLVGPESNRVVQHWLTHGIRCPGSLYLFGAPEPEEEDRKMAVRAWQVGLGPLPDEEVTR